jgi:murein DD-endopeptidase MepM/ murein hydrolase activator NlpD
MKQIDFSKEQFHPIVLLPKSYEICDFTKGYDEKRLSQMTYSVGKYNEKRKNMYTEPQYLKPEGARDIHMGIDIGAPIGTNLHAFYDGEIFMSAYNSQKLDYGYTIITKHTINGTDLYCLLGHLNKESVDNKKTGQKFKKGDVIAWIGDRFDNGGWFPHVHVQLTYEKPEVCDLPGTVSNKDLASALVKYPDPRNILGPIY